MVIGLVLLLVCGLLAAAIARVVQAQERGMHAHWQEGVAEQYAEVALSYCESQLALPAAQRDAPLRAIESSTAVSPRAAAWRQPAAWADAAGRAVTVPAEAVRSTATDLAPTRRPVCLVERVAWSAGQEAYLVTARGFSPGHQQDAAGATTAGAAVWLQSTLVAD